mmetsp:Transcript_83100/g.138617  ORF Transcript_83100/g.138617 Transcript_83100/m.138617 type:complete len:231 (+) Transcript_83100:1024-1716(+)
MSFFSSSVIIRMRSCSPACCCLLNCWTYSRSCSTSLLIFPKYPGTLPKDFAWVARGASLGGLRGTARIFSTALATTKFFSVVNPITGFSVRFGTPGLLGSNADLWKGFASGAAGLVFAPFFINEVGSIDVMTSLPKVAAGFPLAADFPNKGSSVPLSLAVSLEDPCSPKLEHDGGNLASCLERYIGGLIICSAGRGMRLYTLSCCWYVRHMLPALKFFEQKSNGRLVPQQ